MKIKLLGIISLSTFLFMMGCGGSATNTNANANKTNTNANAVVVTATPAPAADPAAKTAVEDAMKKKGFTDVTVEATTTEVTLRGSVAKGKLGEAVQTATEAGKRKVVNQLTEK